MKKRVLFLCKKRIDSYGKPIGLFNSAKFMVNALKKQGIESKLETVVDGNGVDKVATEYYPSHAIIEAFWVTPEKMEELLKLERHKNTQWIVRCHSKTPFLANEGMAFAWMKGYYELAKKYDNFYLAGNNEEFVSSINKSLNWNMIYLPNIYCPSKYDLKDKKIRFNRSLHVGCFGAIRPMKNHTIQALAAIELADKKGVKLFFHVNASRVEQKGESILKNLRSIFEATEHELVEHEWLEHECFLQVVKEMDICMQVSFSESFNIVTADAIISSVPVVVGEDLDWVPSLFRADPTSMDDIVCKLNRVYGWRFLKVIAIPLNKWYLRLYNINSKVIWLDFLYETIDMKWQYYLDN